MNWKSVLIGKWSWKRPFYSIASIYILLAIFAVSCADRMIFMPPPSSYGGDLPGLRYVGSSADDEKSETIAYLHLKADPGKPTLLFSHGNAEDMGHWLPAFREWQSMGLGVMAYDYPGYGKSRGTPTEKSCERAIRWVHGMLTAMEGVHPSSVVIVGRSVGSGPSVWLAAQTKAKALILISPFTSAYDVAIPLPFPVLPNDRFPNLKRIRTIDTPLLVIHGDDDEVIPFSHGEKLFRASPSTTKQFHPVPAAGHNDLFDLAGEEVIRIVAEFAEQPPISRY